MRKQSLCESHRPQKWGEVVGQDSAITALRTLAKRGLAGRAYWISGISGSGKTTIARLLAAEIAEPIAVTELDAGALTVPVLKDLEGSMRLWGWGEKGGKAYIVNEAHGLPAAIVRQLLVMLERLPQHVMFIFTTTALGQKKLFSNIDAGPLLSRCYCIELTANGLEGPFAEHVKTVAKAEGLDSAPVSAYLRLAQRCKCNMRAMFQAVECGEMVAAKA